MHIPILIEPLEGGRFRARAGAPFQLSVEAADRQEAVRQLQQAIDDCLRGGAEVRMLAIGNPPPAASAAGSLKDHPLWDEFLEAIAENRRREDAENP